MKYNICILILLFALFFVACQDEKEENLEQRVDACMVTGSVDVLSVEGLSINTFVEKKEIKGNEYSINVLSNDLPQLLFVTNSNDDVVMISRGFPQSDLKVIGSKSTALALVSMHPLFITHSEKEYHEVIGIIEASPCFSDFLSEVDKSIKSNANLLDVNNEDLLKALHNLLEDLCKPMLEYCRSSRAAVDGVSHIPFAIEYDGNILSVRNKGYSPTYECKVYYGGKEVQEFNKLLMANKSYGYLDLFDDLSNISKLKPENHLGEPLKMQLKDDGEYYFEFDCTTDRAREDFAKRLWADALTIPGFHGNTALYIDSFLNGWQSIVALLVDPTTTPADITLQMGSWLTQLGIESAGNTAIRFADGAKIINNLFNILSAFKGAYNEISRIIWGLRAEKIISFCLCSYNNEISSCTKSSLTVVEHTNNQIGIANQPLEMPIQVLVESMAEDNTLIKSIYQKVKFEVVSGDGSISQDVVETDDNGFAKTFWTLGNDGEQKVKAYVVDMITGIVVSEPVYFSATLQEEEEVDDDYSIKNIYNLLLMEEEIEGTVHKEYFNNSQIYAITTYESKILLYSDLKHAWYPLPSIIGDSKIISKKVTDEKVVLSFELIDESDTTMEDKIPSSFDELIDRSGVIYFDWIFLRINNEDLLERVKYVVTYKAKDKTLFDDEEDE